MAEVSVDTSSYPKPGLPVSPLDIAGKLGGLQAQALSINQQKLDQANQGLTYMTRAMGALGPNASKEQYIDAASTAVKMGLVPPQALDTFKQRAMAAPDSQSFYNEFMTTAATHQQQIDYHLGKREDVGNGQQITPAVSSVKPGFGVRPISLPIQQQAPPTTQSVDTNTGQQRVLGAQPPQLPVGAIPAGSLPGQFREPLPASRPAPAIPGPVTSPAIQGQSSNFGGNVLAANVEPPTFNQRYDAAFPKPQGAATAPPPMFEEGKKQLMEDQALSAQKMTAVKPAILALKLLPGLRTGPGTEPWNKAVAFLKANNIITTAQENDPTVVYQEANKYFSQYLKGRGGRSDADLAMAEKSSPNVGVQLNPALTNLARSAVAQDRVEAARSTAFNSQDYSKYGQHRATFPQSVDERAFSLDLMPAAESKKLTDQMYQKYKKNPNNPEAIKFFKSLDIAKKQGFFSGNQE